MGFDRRHLLLAATAAATLPSAVRAAPVQPVLRVGIRQQIRTLAAAASVATDGMLVEVDAGDYVGDVATWSQQDLTLRAVGGPVRLLADGRAAEGKAIFVVNGPRMAIEGFEFHGCAVPDRNGAGIRLQRGSLALRGCRFHANETGVLAANDATIKLAIERCEFGAIRRGEGYTHQLYAGAIAELKVADSRFTGGLIGHLLKSRALHSEIRDCRFGGADDMASYELEFPNGGAVVLVGNVIEQGRATRNRLMVSFGAEGYGERRCELELLHNTFIDHLGGLRGGQSLRVMPGAVRIRAHNNLCCGNNGLGRGLDLEQLGNFVVQPAVFADFAQGDFRLRADAPPRGRAVAAGPLAPATRYREPGALQS